MPASAPGPDGLPYSFWASAGPTATTYLGDSRGGDTDGAPLPRSPSAPHTVWIPKGEFTEDIARVRRKVGALRAIMLMQTSGNTVATVANEEPSEIDSRVVVGNQRGFIKGRKMADIVIEFEGAAYGSSQLHERTPVGILLDIAQEFPSLARAWMWAIIAKIRRFCSSTEFVTPPIY